MYNTDTPTRAELPTAKQLARSTMIAGVSAIAILVAVVLPSEYAIDPTGVGGMLGLTEMGQIKTQLAAEAEADAASDAAAAAAGQAAVPVTAVVRQSAPAAAPVPVPAATANAAAAAAARTDEISVTLKPGQGAEVKMRMKEGAQVRYSWTANGAVVNVDAHGDGGGRSISYETGRGVGNAEGTMQAAFDGNHGWFWRNRTERDVTVTLRTNGDYAQLKRVL